VQSPSNRSVIIISGLLTLLVLGCALLAVAFRNGWLQTTPGTPRTAAVTTLAQATEADLGRMAGAGAEIARFSPATSDTEQNEVAIYRGKLEDAYRALDEAYAQVSALQTAQSQVSSRPGREDESAEHSDERHERRPRHRDADND